MDLPKKTCTRNATGYAFGSGYLNILGAIAFAINHNYIFLPTPLPGRIAHCQNGHELNKFIGFSGYSKPNQVDIDLGYIKNPLLTSYPHRLWTPEALRVIRKFYYIQEKGSKCPTDIAIHIRRGDVGSEFTTRFTSNEAYREIILLLKKDYPDYSIGLYSQGDTSDFKDLLDLDVSFQLNTPLEEVFHHFVTAKILVTAKSSLSFAAGIISENIIYCIPILNWCFALPTWKILFTEGAPVPRVYRKRIEEGVDINYISAIL